MRKFWFGFMLLPLAGLTPCAPAQEVIATTRQANPVAATPAAGPTMPVVNLGRPRVVRPAAPADSGVVQASFRPAESPAGSDLLPRPARVGEPITRGAAPDEHNEFGIERVAFLMPDAAPPKPTKEAVPAMPKTILSPDGPPTLSESLFEEHAEAAPFRIYGSVEYLAWWTKNADIPPLATTSTNPVAPVGPGAPTDFGVIGGTNTVLLFGNEIDHSLQQGARLRLGYWLPDHHFAVEASYFALANRTEHGSFTSDGSQVILRPFFDANEGFENGEAVAGPAVGPGTLTISSPLSLQGAELNLRCPAYCDSGCCGGVKVDLFGGARWLRLREKIDIVESGVALAAPPLIPFPQQFRIEDRFETINNFYGGQVGVTAEYRRGPFSVEGRASVALGLNHEVVNVDGSGLFINPDGSTQRSVGGLLALPSNIGHHERNRFAVAPELGVTFGYQVTDAIKVFAGYNFLWISDVVRAGDQIDRVLDITQIPGFVTPLGNGTFRTVGGAIVTPLSPPRPVVPFKETSFWAQGATLGIEFRY